jgi:hypothetical protein
MSSDLTLTEKDNKAELAVIVHLHKKPESEKHIYCDFIGLPWEEYQRILRKWSRVIIRWEKEGGRNDNRENTEKI